MRDAIEESHHSSCSRGTPKNPCIPILQATGKAAHWICSPSTAPGETVYTKSIVIYLILSLALLLGACSPYVVPNALDSNSLRDQGVLVISTTSDAVSASFASCLLIKSVVDNGDKGHCLILDGSMPKSDFTDHHGHFYVLALNPGSYETSLFFLNAYARYVGPSLGGFDIKAGQILYLGDAYLVHQESNQHYVKYFDHHVRDISIFHQHDPALANQDVEMAWKFAADSRPDTSRQLPLPDAGMPALTQDYRLHQLSARDAAGHSISGVSADRISVLENDGEWDQSSPGEVPAVPMAIPNGFRSQVQLFYDKHTHWIMVPAGWILSSVGEGVDGTVLMTFTAPTGAKDGWMKVFEVSGCVTCMYVAADGIIPRAHEALDKSYEQHTAEPALVPRPQSLVPMGTCAALIRYQPPSSAPVSGAVYLQTDDSEMASVYIALPESQSVLADFITRGFLDAHARCGAK